MTEVTWQQQQVYFSMYFNREFMFKVTIKQDLLLIHMSEIVCKKDRY